MRSYFHSSLLILIAVLSPCCSRKATTPIVAPAAPASLTVTPLSTCQLQLDWPDTSTNETNYIVQRSLDGTTYVQIAVLAADTTRYNDFGLQPSFLYLYRVLASNSAGVSAPAEDLNFTMDLLWNGPTTGGPPPRAFHSAVYDNIAQRMILFGGAGPGLLGDLWQLSLPDPTSASPVWSPLTATGTPPSPRVGHSAVFDSPNNRMIVFGGQKTGSGASAFLNDLWILSLTGTPTWTQIVAVPPPPPVVAPIATNYTGNPPTPRRNHTASYDPIRREMLVFGGSDYLGQFSGDMVILSLPATGPFPWSSPLALGSSPVARELHSAVHDPLGPRMIVFAGHDNDPTNGNAPSGGDGSVLNGETWTLSPTLGYGWGLSTFVSSPPMRQAHSAVFDVLNRRMVIFGGEDDAFNALTPDMWALNVWNQPGWTLMATTGGPSGLFNHSAVYDDLYHRMVLFGGRTTLITFTDNLWWIVQ